MLIITRNTRVVALNAQKRSGIAMCSGTSTYHVPVMLKECCDELVWKKGGVYVDCTLGGGGHTNEILRRGGKVIGIDQDPDAIEAASLRLKCSIDEASLEIVQSNFRRIKEVVRGSPLTGEDGQVDGVIMDLGISSHQIDKGERGFAFGHDGPLDMRMSQGTGPEGRVTAAEIVNEWSEEAIADILFDYGEEPRARRLARAIVAARPFATTGALKQVINDNTHFNHQTKTLARCFQALRIVVNDEIVSLNDALSSLHEVVRPGGRLVIMSYHSLEDRPIKRLINSGQLPTSSIKSEFLFWRPVTRKARTATQAELASNSRARSAKLRIAERIHALRLDELEHMPGREKRSKYRSGTVGAKEQRKKRAAAGDRLEKKEETKGNVERDR